MDSFENFFTQFMSDGTSSKSKKETTSDASDKTLDDMKEIEHRPKKRNDATITNNLFYRNNDRYKRNCPSEVPIDSTAVAVEGDQAGSNIFKEVRVRPGDG
ncbi:hypothetical protein RhiirC2_705366 [Rhizophagus irregularis]|uniref:Uncharacterized protein n=1 Tax=Rhizophagus irregularis TaxID=588596 RepID=A0A2N1NYJ2_9GLOM|nr:hypothetical protein RhiirC2_705366 [Rhizophagus irregularis]